MLRPTLRHILAPIAVLSALLMLVWITLDYFLPTPPATFAIATGPKGQNYATIGSRYQEILARSGITLQQRHTHGAEENLRQLNDAKSGVKLGLVQGGLSDAQHAPELLSMGRITYQPSWIFYRSNVVLDDVRQLRGQRIAVSLEGSGSRIVAEKVLRAAGVNPENTTIVSYTLEDAAAALNDGRVDVLFHNAIPESRSLKLLLNSPNVRLMSLSRAEALTEIFPFLVRLVVRQGVLDFEKNLPSSDTVILATTLNVMVRKDTHPAIIDLMAKTLVEAHSRPALFQKAGEFPTQSDPEYPMAEGAQEFYKNGPSFFNRYLPFWMTVYARRAIAVLATAIAIVLPLFSYGPRLYKAFVEYRIRSIYRTLRSIDSRLQNDVTAADLVAYEIELERIDKSISVLGVPMQYSDLFFSMKSHLDVVRARLAKRRAGMPQTVATPA